LSSCRAASLFEFLMLRHGILTIHADFTRSYFDVFLLRLLARMVQIIYSFSVCRYVPFFLFYFVYDLHINNNRAEFTHEKILQTSSRGSVTITIESSTNGATTLSRMNLSAYVGHATVFS